jgi:hypothetical protein
MIESYLIGIGMSFFFAAIIAVLWVRGIDYMHKNHPDYKGDDLFGKFDEDESDHIL